MKKIFAAVAFAVFAASAFAHSGGTDKQGCHWDHKSGTYHCH